MSDVPAGRGDMMTDEELATIRRYLESARAEVGGMECIVPGANLSPADIGAIRTVAFAEQLLAEVDRLRGLAEQPQEATAEEPVICIDCAWHSEKPQMSSKHPGYCVHHTVEFWQDQGYAARWGDAAVRMWPHLHILRRVHEGTVEYIILAPAGGIRRPVQLEASVSSWGSY